MNHFDKVRNSVTHFGVMSTVHDVAVKAMNRVILFKVIKGMTVEHVSPASLKCPEPYRPMFLDETMLRKFSRDPETRLSEDFLDEALSKGDECYGILDGDGSLAAYGWYARTSTRVDPPDLKLSFSDRYIYMYKGYTGVRHRGQRLHAIGMVRALDHYLNLGYTGLISYIESNNFSSLKSGSRMGYVEIGHIAFAKIWGHFLIVASPKCRPFGFRIEPVRANGNAVPEDPGPRSNETTW